MVNQAQADTETVTDGTDRFRNHPIIDHSQQAGTHSDSLTDSGVRTQVVMPRTHPGLGSARRPGDVQSSLSRIDGLSEPDPTKSK
jgi:hypothetical protein